MNAPRILTSLDAHLRPLIEAQGGTLEICGTVEDTLARLAQAPGKWRVILQWQREEALGSTRTAVELRFLAIVQQGRGLSIDAGADVHKNRATDPALLARMNHVRSLIRAVRWQHPEIDGVGPQLRSTQWLTDPGLPTRQITIEFSLQMGLDSITPAAIPIL